MDKNKLGQLIRGRWGNNKPNEDAEQVVEKTEKLDIAISGNLREKSGELVPFKSSSSQLSFPNAPVHPWSVFWMVLVALTGGISLLSYFVLVAVPPLPNCKQISVLSTDSERLYCAKLGAETNDKKKVIEAISLVRGWSEGNPLFTDGKNLLDEWSTQLIKITRKELIAGGDVDKAIESLKNIPAYSSAYPEAQKNIRQWDKQWEVGEKLEAQMIKAIQTGDWYNCYGILSKIQALRSSYWRNIRHSELSIQLAKEKEAWDKYEAAEVAAQGEDPNAYRAFRRSAKKVVIPSPATQKEPVAYSINPATLSEAISLASQVPQGTFVKKTAQARREVWGKTILAIATEKLNAQKYAEAVAAAQKVPKDLSSFKAAATVAQRAASLLAASGGQQPEVTEPIASGKVAVQRVDSQNILAQAHTVAQIGSIESFNQAINLVGKIPVGQPLHAEAQTAAKAWEVQIQVIRDQPVLDAARSLAGGGRLTAAIEKAESIPANHVAARTIYNELNRWRKQLAEKKLAEQKLAEQKQKQRKSSKTLVPALSQG